MCPKCLLAGFAMVAFLAACLVSAAVPDEELQRVNALVSAELETGPKRMVLNQDYLIVRGPGGEQRKVRVILVMRVYRVKVLQEGVPRLRDGRFHSYEIRSVEGDDLFTWSMRSSGPLGMFRLFSNERGENYLAWVQGGTVCLLKVTEPRDPLMAVTEALSTEGRSLPGVIRVPTERFIDRKHHGWNAFYNELSVEALEVAQAGSITVKVRAVRTDEVFTLVFDGKEWRKE